MKIKLLKDHKFLRKIIPAGTEMEITREGFNNLPEGTAQDLSKPFKSQEAFDAQTNSIADYSADTHTPDIVDIATKNTPVVEPKLKKLPKEKTAKNSRKKL